MEINIIRGDDCRVTFSLNNGGTPYILQTGDKLTFTVKQSTNLDNAVIVKRYGDGITRNPITGKYEVILNGDCSCDLKCIGFIYDIELVLANGKVKTLAKDEFNITQDCTRPCNREVE